MHHVLKRAALVPTLCLAFSSVELPAQTNDRDGIPATVPLERVVRIFDRTGREVTLDAMLDELQTADAVFVGETHLDDVTHRLEHAIFSGLADRREGKVALSMEMFERDVQPVLDRYLAGEIDEHTFLARSRPWGNYRTGYRDLVEEAKRRGLPVFAANVPASVRVKLTRGRQAAWDALSEVERAWVPETLLPNSEAYWDRFDHLMKDSSGHAMPMPAGSRLFMGQSLWDNTMGDTCAKALEAHPGWQVVHVAGGFHVEAGLGTVEQFLARAKGATARVVQIGTTFDLAAVGRSSSSADRADFLAIAEARANGPSQGRIAVHVPGEIGYRFDLPSGPHPETGRPLLVWLHGRGTRTADAEAYWNVALRNEAAIAVLEPLYPERAADLAESGRWSHPSRRDDDRPRVRVALERLVEHLARTYPIDPDRIVVAGEGEGASMALIVALESSSLAARYVVVEPLPLVQYIAPYPRYSHAAARGVTLVGAPSEAHVEKWKGRYEAVDVSVTVLGGRGLPQVERLVREQLGSPVPPSSEDIPEDLSKVLWLTSDAPRARTFAEIQARSMTSEDERCIVLTANDRERFVAFLAARADDAPAIEVQPLAIDDVTEDLSDLGAAGATLKAPYDASSFASGRALPIVDVPFGGTTILVLPGTTSSEKRAAWRKLEGRAAISQRHRFANLRIAFAVEEPSLAQVVSELVRGGETDLLIVPAVYCADENAMRALADLARPALGNVEPLWLPGLGAELHRISNTR